MRPTNNRLLISPGPISRHALASGSFQNTNATTTRLCIPPQRKNIRAIAAATPYNGSREGGTNAMKSNHDPGRSFFRHENIFWIVTIAVAIAIALLIVRRVL